MIKMNFGKINPRTETEMETVRYQTRTAQLDYKQDIQTAELMVLHVLLNQSGYAEKVVRGQSKRENYLHGLAALWFLEQENYDDTDHS